MWLLIAEAVLAGAMFVFIVWWTMSSRRKPESNAAADPALKGPQTPVSAAVPGTEPGKPGANDQA